MTIFDVQSNFKKQEYLDPKMNKMNIISYQKSFEINDQELSKLINRLTRQWSLQRRSKPSVSYTALLLDGSTQQGI